jgi:hypothetical protein
MATVSGVPVQNITGISGVDATSITAISGVLTSTIPGWPSSGPTCTPFSLGFSDGRRNPLTDACTAIPRFYDWDATNELLYDSGGCGVTFARIGYYSDGATIYFWGGSAGSWVEVQPCPR